MNVNLKKRTSRSNNLPKSQPSVLRFSPLSWAKLLFFRDHGDTEIGAFGIARSDDLLCIQDLQLVKQTCSWAHVAFDDHAIADFFDEQVDAGRTPAEFFRVWIHSHPGDCPNPSQVDEETFARVFGGAEFSVMFIIARTGSTYCRLQFNVGPRASVEIPVEVDYTVPFQGSDHDAWQREYSENVQRQVMTADSQKLSVLRGVTFEDVPPEDWLDDWYDYVDEDDPTNLTEVLDDCHKLQ